MLEFFCTNLNSILVTVGLLCDIGGAILIGWEAFRKYKGDRFQSASGLGLKNGAIVDQSDVQPTADFIHWEEKREKLMKVGLGILCLGFSLQLVGQWL